MIPSQMLKGILENCILKIISLHETYGYAISQKLQSYGFMEISEGTIYPLLLRLEKNGLITASYKASDSGPPRKYFFITRAGQEELERFFKSWQEMETAINRIFEEEER